ncbi:MAG TPA: response regulator [Pyrinomonadaceae bacterium]|nr:response regulator [Pyrinomonadaceae bacterium]
MSKVLVVDDYEDTRDLIRFLLEMYGFEVSEATNGLEALESVKRQVPDLVLMDISMPYMDGLTAARKLREQPRFAKLPIIAITAQSEGYKKRAIEAGYDELIPKPINIDDLRPVINKHLSH